MSSFKLRRRGIHPLAHPSHIGERRCDHIFYYCVNKLVCIFLSINNPKALVSRVKPILRELNEIFFQFFVLDSVIVEEGATPEEIVLSILCIGFGSLQATRSGNRCEVQAYTLSILCIGFDKTLC
jgi:hypothetical protein